MKSNLFNVALYILALNVITFSLANKIITLQEGSANEKTLQVKTFQDYKISGDYRMMAVIEYSNGLNCSAIWYVQAGSPPTKADYYLKKRISGSGTSSFTFRTIKCFWFFRIEITNPSATICKFKIRYTDFSKADRLNCCQTMCKNVRNSQSPNWSGHRIMGTIIFISALFNYFFY